MAILEVVRGRAEAAECQTRTPPRPPPDALITVLSRPLGIRDQADTSLA